MGIQINQKELTETFMSYDFKLKNTFGLHGWYKIFQRCKGYGEKMQMKLEACSSAVTAIAWLLEA